MKKTGIIIAPFCRTYEGNCCLREKDNKTEQLMRSIDTIIRNANMKLREDENRMNINSYKITKPLLSLELAPPPLSASRASFCHAKRRKTKRNVMDLAIRAVC